MQITVAYSLKASYIVIGVSVNNYCFSISQLVGLLRQAAPKVILIGVPLGACRLTCCRVYMLAGYGFIRKVIGYILCVNTSKMVCRLCLNNVATLVVVRLAIQISAAVI